MANDRKAPPQVTAAQSAAWRLLWRRLLLPNPDTLIETDDESDRAELSGDEESSTRVQ